MWTFPFCFYLRKNQLQKLLSADTKLLCIWRQKRIISSPNSNSDDTVLFLFLIVVTQPNSNCFDSFQLQLFKGGSNLKNSVHWSTNSVLIRQTKRCQKVRNLEKNSYGGSFLSFQSMLIIVIIIVIRFWVSKWK